jgi:hypothetical protein
VFSAGYCNVVRRRACRLDVVHRGCIFFSLGGVVRPDGLWRQGVRRE